MTSSSSLDPSPVSVPYARRRNTPAQLHALHQLFDATPHPTRAQRQTLADQTGMELKSVTNWFQNRRQLSRRKSLSCNENNPTRLLHSPVCHPRRRSKTPLDRSKISLDRIAALSERPSLTLQPDAPRLPLTPRKSNVQQTVPSSPSDIWTHMLSSPAVPRSSPDPDEARLAVLSSQAKILCPLEWACFKARQKTWADKDADGLSLHPVLTRCRKVDAGHQVIGTATVSQHSDASSRVRKDAPSASPDMVTRFGDVEAAITLLDFKTRS